VTKLKHSTSSRQEKQCVPGLGFSELVESLPCDKEPTLPTSREEALKFLASF